jgi:hypothetical protein
MLAGVDVVQLVPEPSILPSDGKVQEQRDERERQQHSRGDGRKADV